MPTLTHGPPTAVDYASAPPTRVHRPLEQDGPAPTSGAPNGSDGFLRLLAREAIEQARTAGPASALRDRVRMETFLRTFRRHLLVTPPDARGGSYNVGLIVIELLIARESLRSPGRPPTN